MSATLGALVIAISTDSACCSPSATVPNGAPGAMRRDALARTYRLTGAAVLASGLTAIAGFGVLVLSNITMLRDFGFVTLIDLTVSLAGVLVVLPAVLALSERAELREQASPARAAWRRRCPACGAGPAWRERRATRGRPSAAGPRPRRAPPGAAHGRRRPHRPRCPSTLAAING